jgi:Fic family protein
MTINNQLLSPLGNFDLTNALTKEVYSKLDILDSLTAAFNETRQSQVATHKSIIEDFEIQFTYNSNAIEGNTLTLSQTKVVLEGVTIGGKTINEHLEATNHKAATDFILDLAKESKDIDPFTEENILQIHKIILDKIDPTWAGSYRGDQVFITGARHVPPHYGVVELMTKQFVEDEKQWNLHPVLRAALIHGEFVGIHPFRDGNGRTSRLLMNLEVLRNGYAPIIIHNENRAEYYDALDAAHVERNYLPFFNFVIDEATSNVMRYNKLLGVTKILGNQRADPKVTEELDEMDRPTPASAFGPSSDEILSAPNVSEDNEEFNYLQQQTLTQIKSKPITL